jgi:DNA-binding MarR family transcriptional regulator
MSRRLQQELKKRGPFASLAQQAILGLARTTDQLLIRLERLIRERDLTGPQYNVLRILRGEGRPLPMQEIASRTVQVVPGMTGLVDRLEAAGLVKRERCSEDRRVIYVAITKRALAVLEQIDEPLLTLEKELLASISAKEQEQLIAILDRVRAGLEERDADTT